MNQGLQRKAGRTRWTLALGLAISTAVVAALLGAKPVSGHEEAQVPAANSVVHTNLAVGHRSVGEFFPTR